MTPKEFYDHYKPFADAAAAGTNVFPDTILAAAALESGYGKSSYLPTIIISLE